jgi:hypothetical protein
MTQTLTITVSGENKTGKSSLAYLLANYLINLGSTVEVLDEWPSDSRRFVLNAATVVREHHVVIRTAPLTKDEPSTFKAINAPWARSAFNGWDIVGMNHYHVNNDRYLFIAMTKGSRLIRSEGLVEYTDAIWDILESQALLIDREESK